MLEKLKKTKKQKLVNKNSSEQETTVKTTVKKKKIDVFSIVSTVGVVAAHVAILAAIALSFRYYDIYPSIFGSVVALVLCLLIVVDIIFFVGLNHKDLVLKIISFVMALFILLGGTFGTYFVNKANNAVNGVLDNGSDKYETYSGVFLCYDKNNNFNSLSDLKGKKVGLVTETTNGVTYLATEELNAAKIDYATVNYKTNTEMMQALLDGDVDAIAITVAYRTIYGNDENSSFVKYMENLKEFHSFEKELKIDSTKKKKNLNTDPFNVLLIGYSRTDIGSPIGLADSIILTTINPQTYTVSMMSIARDSFVPIACYGGEYDKINSGRSTSRACFVETVENFIGMDIDYYMELDYLGLVAIVNTIGGIKINNPVSFELDGIYVPAGEDVFADGQMALQFCRERHHMPNGDFDRQQHQKEVIMAIAKKFIQSGDITLALNAMEAASDWMSTDMTLSQLTGVFNLLLNTKNYTSLGTFDLVDFQTLRITGSGGIMYYSYSMRLPLWVYLIYKGSYDESINHINEIMGRYPSIKQDYKMEFSAQNPYVRAPFYSLDYDNVFMFTPDPMPAYWPDLTGLSESEAREWAKNNGVSLSVKVISVGSDGYDEKLQGQVVDQSVRYGSLVHSEKGITGYSSGEITVMGMSDPNKVVPNFVGSNYKKAVEWANNKGIYCSIEFDSDIEGDVGKVVSQTPGASTSIDDCDVLKIVVKSGKYKITFDANGVDTEMPASITVETGDATKDLPRPSTTEVTVDGKKYVFTGWYTQKEGGDKMSKNTDVAGNVTLYAHWNQLYVITLNANGGDCSRSSITSNESLPSASMSHYSFNGWFTAASGGTEVTDPSTLTSATTLYAQYKELPTYKYEFISDGSVIDSGTLYVDQDPPKPEASKEGYRFTGWSSSGSKDGGSVTYTAEWEEIVIETPDPDEGEEVVE